MRSKESRRTKENTPSASWSNVAAPRPRRDHWPPRKPCKVAVCAKSCNPASNCAHSQELEPATFCFASFSSSSSFLLASSAWAVTKERVEASTSSAIASARDDVANDGTPSEARAAAWSLTCGPSSAKRPRLVPGGGVFGPCRASCVTFTTSFISGRSTTCFVDGPELWWRGFCEGHRYRQPLVIGPRAKSSLPATSGCARVATSVVTHGTQKRQKLRLTLVVDRLTVRALVVVVVVVVGGGRGGGRGCLVGLSVKQRIDIMRKKKTQRT